MTVLDTDTRSRWTDRVLEQIDGCVVWWSPDGSIRHSLNARLEAAVARARAADPGPPPVLALAACRTVRPTDAQLPARRTLRRVA